MASAPRRRRGSRCPAPGRAGSASATRAVFGGLQRRRGGSRACSASPGRAAPAAARPRPGPTVRPARPTALGRAALARRSAAVAPPGGSQAGGAVPSPRRARPPAREERAVGSALGRRGRPPPRPPRPVPRARSAEEPDPPAAQRGPSRSPALVTAVNRRRDGHDRPGGVQVGRRPRPGQGRAQRRPGQLGGCSDEVDRPRAGRSGRQPDPVRDAGRPGTSSPALRPRSASCASARGAPAGESDRDRVRELPSAGRHRGRAPRLHLIRPHTVPSSPGSAVAEQRPGPVRRAAPTAAPPGAPPGGAPLVGGAVGPGSWRTPGPGRLGAGRAPPVPARPGRRPPRRSSPSPRGLASSFSAASWCARPPRPAPPTAGRSRRRSPRRRLRSASTRPASFASPPGGRPPPGPRRAAPVPRRRAPLELAAFLQHLGERLPGLATTPSTAQPPARRPRGLGLRLSGSRTAAAGRPIVDEVPHPLGGQPAVPRSRSRQADSRYQVSCAGPAAARPAASAASSAASRSCDRPAPVSTRLRRSRRAVSSAHLAPPACRAA